MLAPKLSLDFTTGTLDSRVSFTRVGATATHANSSGFIEPSAADTPRFDYSPVTLAPLGLLIEEARANNFIYSDEFDNAAWTKANLKAFGSGSVANATEGPDNTLSADLITSEAATALTGVFVATTIPVTAQAYTFSVFVKPSGVRYVQLWIAGSGANTVLANFDLQTGTRTLLTGGGAINGTITPFANGFYRLTLSYTSVVGNSAPYFSFVNAGNSTRASSFAGDGTKGAYIWGAQFEAGAFATSYIPTTTTALTRNADVAAITGANFSSFWQASKGGVLVRALPSTVSGTRPLVQVDDATADNIIALRGNTTNPELYIRAGGSDQATIDAGTIAANASYRLAGAWATDNCAASLNSGLAVTDSSATIPAVTQARLGSDGTNYLNGHLEAVEYYDQRVLNSTLQHLTTYAGRRSVCRPIINRVVL